MDTVYGGVDIANAPFTAARWPAGQAQELGTCPNPPAGYAALPPALAGPGAVPAAVQLTVEPTGGSELGVAHWADGQGWRVSGPTPRQVREWASGRGRRAKTDRQAAVVLARYGAARQPPAWQPWRTEWSELDRLRRRKAELRARLRQERNRQQARAVRPGSARAVPKSITRLIEAREAERREIEQALAALERAAPLAPPRARLQTVPGVGPAPARPLLGLLERWAQLTQGRGEPKGMVAYVGLAPQPDESGTSVHRRAAISRQGNRTLRARLSRAALGGSRGDNPRRHFDDRLVGRHQAKKLARVAAAR
ncbi:MAG TPA: transposase, partial [Chloroflexota bacterium]